MFLIYIYINISIYWISIRITPKVRKKQVEKVLLVEWDSHTVDGSEIVHQLMLVVHPIIYGIFLHPRWCRISSMNCSYWPLFQWAWSFNWWRQLEISGPCNVFATTEHSLKGNSTHNVVSQIHRELRRLKKKTNIYLESKWPAVLIGKGLLLEGSNPINRGQAGSRRCSFTQDSSHHQDDSLHFWVHWIPKVNQNLPPIAAGLWTLRIPKIYQFIWPCVLHSILKESKVMKKNLDSKHTSSSSSSSSYLFYATLPGELTGGNPKSWRWMVQMMFLCKCWVIFRFKMSGQTILFHKPGFSLK